MSKVASKKAMAELHSKLAAVMKEFLEDGVTVMDDKTGELVKLTPGAPYLNVVRQFLKDNGIDNPSVGEELDQTKPSFPNLPFTSADAYGNA